MVTPSLFSITLQCSIAQYRQSCSFWSLAKNNITRKDISALQIAIPANPKTSDFRKKSLNKTMNKIKITSNTKINNAALLINGNILPLNKEILVVAL
ncbi:TPA: hypothetical protein ACOVJB_002529 [Klebsiella oxytoca]